MTCIVGIKTERGAVVIGGDSAGVGGMSLSVRSDKKVFKNGKFVFGFTSSFRMGQILQYSFKPPERRHGDDIMKFMVIDFIDALREAFKAGGIAKTDSGVESCGSFLVGYAGRLFTIDSDYQIGEAAIGYDAVGCGADVALGSMYSTESLAPQDRVLSALRAAERHSAGVRGPFNIVTLEP